MGTRVSLDITVLGPRAELVKIYTALQGTDLADRLAGGEGYDHFSLLETFFPVPACVEGVEVREIPYRPDQFVAKAGQEAVLAAMTDANLEYERRRALAIELCGYGTELDWRRAIWGSPLPDIITWYGLRPRSIHILASSDGDVPTRAFEFLTEMFPVTIRCRWRVADAFVVRGRVVARGGALTRIERVYRKGWGPK